MSDEKPAAAAQSSSEHGQASDITTAKRVHDLSVLESELTSLKTKNARVYKQQPNSGVFFLVDDKAKVLSEVRKTIHSLKR